MAINPYGRAKQENISDYGQYRFVYHHQHDQGEKKKMLNKEKYAKEIVEIAVNNGTIALKDNKPISCIKIKCIDCEQNVHGCGCSMKKLTEWANSEYKEPILTKEEKSYLSEVIKPFIDKVTGILKGDNGSEFIRISVENDGAFRLPYFKKGSMYKNMKTNKKYKLEELGL